MEEGILEQEVDPLNGKPARRQAGRNCESTIAAAALINTAG